MKKGVATGELSNDREKNGRGAWDVDSFGLEWLCMGIYRIVVKLFRTIMRMAALPGRLSVDSLASAGFREKERLIPSPLSASWRRMGLLPVPTQFPDGSGR